ncbi:hypothetical protein [Sphingomonas arenae]|uniref:hypothetical protein n=1 Tax=Sphingomonas arenae TaxID=2812555 RepID=UPI001967AE20|nr:hypothetical protein [Sphingomonas arenae]
MAPVEAACVQSVMSRWVMLAAAVVLSGCGNDEKWAEGAVPPSVNEMAETPGDWSRLAGSINRTPGDSGLLTNSPITVDLNAMLGPDVDAYRGAMADSGPLHWESGLLVSRSHAGRGYLVIDPRDHAMEAGLQSAGKWRSYRTSGSDLARPPTVVAMVGD